MRKLRYTVIRYMLEDDDIKLFLAFQRGDKQSLEKLLDKYEKPVLNFIYHIVGSREDAEDLAQEVFLRIYLAAANYKPSAKFSTWLYRIATNICIDYRRKPANKLQRITDSLDKPVDTEENEITKEIADTSKNLPENILEQKQVDETIQSALLSLPVNQRVALTLRMFENKSYQEISAILGCSVSSVESLLFRARQNLKQKLTASF
ncbi:MAG: sigma-70 family RNA polymerase sigma factor [Elusimicrobiota bacterium]|nr:sigma-70 family RNA polymerase sigma factor [Elusimicrobiota bacterium]